MTAIELDAFKMQLIRDILAINNLEMLDDVKKYVRQLTKIHQSQCSSEFMLNIPATVEELKESVERGLADIKAADVRSVSVQTNDLPPCTTPCAVHSISRPSEESKPYLPHQPSLKQNCQLPREK